MNSIYHASSTSMRKMSRKRSPQSPYHLRWNANTPVPAASGSGNTSFPPTGCRKTRGQGSSAAITLMRMGCNAPSVGPVMRQGSPNASVVIPYATALRVTIQLRVVNQQQDPLYVID
jgi:hypothetical protein